MADTNHKAFLDYNRRWPEESGERLRRSQVQGRYRLMQPELVSVWDDKSVQLETSSVAKKGEYYQVTDGEWIVVPRII
ncbi:hypothetical protein [Bradyrhizobium sp. Arg816]|uniref:hypothetical protein n=1 Tax=Bradyrhizobium sp. Arg816 TaxID=2998491 RepID=UPI00249DEBF8|nr:hypothetical protein [Bradyrhizobium sp. Arg816]MDI3560218.1 hypothetical protein [Bradyrhizobium sp. Arg816]